MTQGMVCNARSARHRRVKSAVRTAATVAVFAVGVSGQPAEQGEAVTDLQRQVNELRSDLLDEREKRIVSWQESNGTVLVVVGIMIGIGGIWAYAKFRAIATVAATGVALERGHAVASWDTLPQPGTAPVSPGQALQPVRLLVPAGPEPSSPAAMRHDPDHPQAWLEPGDLKARQGQYEGAIADYDQAIRLDPRNAGAYGNRSLAKSELGRQDEALEDLDQARRLDPDMESELGGP